jgi:hypothetical protein
MAHNNFCLLSTHEADLLREGVAPNCRGNEHRHISANEARRIVNGLESRPWDDPDLAKTGFISEAYRPTGQWAILADGTESAKHVVVRVAREWQTFRGVRQWLPIGATAQGMKRTKTKIKPASTYSLTQCRDPNRIPKHLEAAIELRG